MGRPNRLASIKPHVPGERTSPPVTLTDREMRTVWTETLGRMPSGILSPPQAAIFEQFCRVTVLVRRTAAEVDRDGVEDDKLLARYAKLTTLQGMLATKMRLTPQAQQAASLARTDKMDGHKFDKPWESEGNGLDAGEAESA